MTEGGTRGRVVMFTGPTGVGKTTVAHAWASSRVRPTAFFDHDEARFLVRTGYISRRAAAADPTLRPQADEQWLLAARICEAMAEEYACSGVDFSLAAFRPPGQWMGCWARLDAMAPLIVVLMAPIQTCLERDRGRTGRAHTGEASIRRAFSYDWEKWRDDPRAVMIETAGIHVDEIVTLVQTTSAPDVTGQRPGGHAEPTEAN